jgi:hypothetical protein
LQAGFLEPINPTKRAAATATSHEPSRLLIPASQRLLEGRKRPTTITITTIIIVTTTTINNNNNNNNDKRVSRPKLRKSHHQMCTNVGLVGPKKTLEDPQKKNPTAAQRQDKERMGEILIK